MQRCICKSPQYDTHEVLKSGSYQYHRCSDAFLPISDPSSDLTLLPNSLLPATPQQQQQQQKQHEPLEDIQKLTGDSQPTQGLGSEADECISSAQPANLDFCSSSQSLQKVTLNSLVDVYAHLAQILFALRGLQEMLSVDMGSRTLHLKEVFRWVSSLCDVVHLLLDNHCSQDDISPCLMLATSTISTVLEIYRSSIDVSWNAIMPQLATGTHVSDSSESSDIAFMLPFQLQPSSTHQRLERLSDFTSMDFHLAQLLRIYDHSGPAIGNTRTPRRLAQDLRAFLQVLIEESNKIA